MRKKNELTSGMSVQSLGRVAGKGRGKGSTASRGKLPSERKKEKEEKKIIGSIKHEK
jgi:hypothetical protein